MIKKLAQEPTGFLELSQPLLVNLSQGLGYEFLSTNHSGGYMSSTAALCNTRKYHGLMVLPLEHFGGERHVLLSALDETIVVAGQEFHISVRRYPGTYEPRGHKYLIGFKLNPTPTFTYRVGELVLQKELLFSHQQEHLMVRYKVLEGKGPFRLIIRPFLAFRNAHALCHSNMWANGKYSPEPNGMSCRLYTGFPTLYMQTNTASEYVHAPDWFYNIEYKEELARGYDGHEDLFVPGYFEVPLKGNTPLIFSASTSRIVPGSLSRTFQQTMALRPARHDYIAALQAAADQFICSQQRRTFVNAGYPWFGRWGRDTLIALPGLTLLNGGQELFSKVLTSLLREMKGGMLPNMGSSETPAFNSIDAPLWLFWTIQQWCLRTGDWAGAWKNWGKYLRETYAWLASPAPKPYGIALHENGLIWAGTPGVALTWMDAVVRGMPVTPRHGYAVEINALWYNALRFMQEMYARIGKPKSGTPMAELAEKVEKSFHEVFWMPEMGYLADYVGDKGPDKSVRPNQIFAVALPYSPLNADDQLAIVERVRRELYTPWGLRTLSPKNPLYKPQCAGPMEERDSAYHQGTIWPWLLEGYIDAVHKTKGERALMKVCNDIEEAMTHTIDRYGMGSLPEIFDGDPPHAPGGCIAQAWSVAAAMRVSATLHPERFKSPNLA